MRPDSAHQQAMQERRGATFAARTVAFLFARACKRRDAPRAPARILGHRDRELAGRAAGSKSNIDTFLIACGLGLNCGRQDTLSRTDDRSRNA